MYEVFDGPLCKKLAYSLLIGQAGDSLLFHKSSDSDSEAVWDRICPNSRPPFNNKSPLLKQKIFPTNYRPPSRLCIESKLFGSPALWLRSFTDILIEGNTSALPLFRVRVRVSFWLFSAFIYRLFPLTILPSLVQASSLGLSWESL